MLKTKCLLKLKKLRTILQTTGDTCCAGSPYFETNSNDRLRTICCDLGPGGPYISPDCCNGIAFDQNGGQVCCQGQIFGIYRWLSHFRC